MRVLTLKEPFATLISLKIKTTETRSWRTNYRGELYIHTSVKKPDYDYKSDDFKNIADKYDYNKLGYIICKCKLIDCIEMTEEYIEDMKKNHYTDYLCGEYKIGRFAWILDDVEIIEPIEAKGRLGIWHFGEKDKK